MEFELPQDVKALQTLTREVVQKECMPLESKYLPLDMYEEYFPEDEAHLTEVAKKCGLWDAHIPKEFGGGGTGYLTNLVVREQLYYSAVILPQAEIIPSLFEANAYQQERFLYPVLRGEKLSAFAQTEPDSGSDPGNSMKTRAVKRGDTWVINGRKMFTSYSGACDFWQLPAVTDPEKRQHGITMFLVEKGTPGISYREIPTWQYRRTPKRATYELFLENVEVPEKNILGDIGRGFQLGQKWLTDYRLIRGGTSLGQMQRAFDICVDWAKRRHSFGKPIATRQAIQSKIVEMHIDILALRALSYQAARDADNGKDLREDASLIKLVAAQWGHHCLDHAMQIMGGIGLTLELPIARFYRWVRTARIVGGTDEMHTMVLAREILGREYVNPYTNT